MHRSAASTGRVAISCLLLPLSTAGMACRAPDEGSLARHNALRGDAEDARDALDVAGAREAGDTGDRADTADTRDAGAAEDTSTPDSGERYRGAGAACPTGTECDVGFICFNRTLAREAPAGGYCTSPCTGPDQCGPTAFCSAVISQVGTALCIGECNPGCLSQPQRTCSELMGGTIHLGRAGCVPATVTADDGDQCAGYADCQTRQVCLTSELSAPGGYCATVGCTVGDDSTCAGGSADATCGVIQGSDPACLRTCTSTADCRPGYGCADRGLRSRVCTSTHSVGRACAADAECGPPPWRCFTGPAYPGGYCSGAACGTRPGQLTCPENALCFSPTPAEAHCIIGCGSDGECRMGDGYRCLTYSPNDPNAPRGCRVP